MHWPRSWCEKSKGQLVRIGVEEEQWVEWLRERRFESQCRFKKEELFVILVAAGDELEMHEIASATCKSAVMG